MPCRLGLCIGCKSSCVCLRVCVCCVCLCVCLLCVSAVCVCCVCLLCVSVLMCVCCAPRSKIWTPRPSAGPPLPRTAQNFALFFSSPTPIFILFFSLWGSSRVFFSLSSRIGPKSTWASFVCLLFLGRIRRLRLPIRLRPIGSNRRVCVLCVCLCVCLLCVWCVSVCVCCVCCVCLLCLLCLYAVCVSAGLSRKGLIRTNPLA